MEMHKARSGAINSQAELLALQKRARRRLVIACVITFISVSVMWRVRESVPRDVPLPESVTIVGDNLPADLVATQAANEAPPQPNEPIEGVVATSPTAPAASTAAATKSVQPTATTQPDLAASSRATEEADAALQPLPPSAVTPVAKLKESSPHAGASGSIRSAERPAAKPESKPEKSTSTESKPAPHRDAVAILNDRAPPSSSRQKESSHDTASKKLPNKEPEPAAKKPEKSEPSSGGRRYTVQIAALSDDSKAQDLKNKLMAMGVSAQITQVETSKGHINRIRTGSFSSEEEARKVLNRIQQAGVSGIIVNQ